MYSNSVSSERSKYLVFSAFILNFDIGIYQYAASLRR